MTQTHAATAEPAADSKAVRRAAWAGLIGTTLEQYDFAIYGTASALIFNKLFFPNISPVAGMLASFSTYAVGFAARPLGGLIFSRFGDRLGRKFVLVATLLLMGLSTLAIGLLPTYAQAGVLTPMLLVLLRFFQGMGAGAEQAGGATLLTETARKGKRGIFASLVMTGAALGTALGAVAWILVQLLPNDALMSWGWRLVFLSSLVVTITALIIRRKLNESPVFQELKQQHSEAKAPVAETFRHGWKPLLSVFTLNVGSNAQSYTFQVFMASYLIATVGVDKHFVPQVLLLGAICGAIAAVAFGTLSDKIGRKPVYSTIIGALVLLPVPSFIALNTGSSLAIIAVIAVGFILAVFGNVGVQMSYFPELFGSRYRYSGVALGREFSAAFGGGIAPLICTGLMALFGSWVAVAIYMMVIAAISFIASLITPETRDRDLTVPEDAM
jgi:MFS family permease